MIRLALLICFSLFAMALHAQQPQWVELKGRVLDGGDSMGAPYVHIFGLRSKTGSVANVDGTFKVMVIPGDTLRLTSVGYTSKLVALPTDISSLGEPTFLIFREVYHIDEVIVMPKPDMRKSPPTSPPPPPHNPHTPIFGIGSGPGGGVTFGFDTKAAHIRNQQEQISQWEYIAAVDDYVAYRYNADFIQQFVPLADDQIPVFMNYCHIPNEFILQANDYDLAKAIKECYKSFVGQ